ncbi:MAG: putative bifunctional diguanylate cyclase/phosphodiesterase [Gammaproteobacteria bacterium]
MSEATTKSTPVAAEPSKPSHPFPETAPMPATGDSPFRAPFQGTPDVMLIGTEPAAHGWAQKWLNKEDLNARCVATVNDAALEMGQRKPSVIIVESDCRDEANYPAFKTVLGNGLFADVPVIVLCHGAADAQIALDAGAHDVVRKPVDWSVASRRAATLARHSQTLIELDKTRDELRQANTRMEDSRRTLSQLGDTDRLTGLPSLGKFRDILARALCQTDQLALFLIGIERFHVINEAHGREIGDRILEEVGARLRDCLVQPKLHASSGTGVLAACAAKLDGVRFGLFLPFSDSPGHLQTIRTVLTEVLSEPINIDGRIVYLTSSIGGAFSPRDGEDAPKLLFNAEHAMMTVKRRGGGFSVYSEHHGMSSARMLELDRWLREAVAGGELRVAYQPLVNLWNNRIVGAEALLRWQREPHGFISPSEFIPVAERSGIIVEIGDMVIDHACAELRRWQDHGHTGMRTAINLSLIQLRRGDVKRSVENAIDRYNLEPGHIELEISERGAIGNDQRIIRQLHEIKSIGVRLSLDDFGTGDAAIEYLKRLPIDVLKLDRSYVAGALENGVDAVIASALVGLARNMNLTVIAEGVESAEQHQLLRDWGCHIYQGFYCSPAVYGDAFLDLLQQQSRATSQEFGP